MQALVESGMADAWVVHAHVERASKYHRGSVSLTSSSAMPLLAKELLIYFSTLYFSGDRDIY